ncbi:MAG: hypothetical protein HYV26_14165 [Candidatus Hydrogenedentes bacterium]|nr:hypothetical protein [Candidatus Hydrogenedentota bacterium]
MAIPRLMHVNSKFPGTPAAIESTYYLGITYHKIGGLKDAQDYFNQYLHLAPEGRYVQSSQDYLATLTKEVEDTMLTPQGIDQRIQAVETAGKQGPLSHAQQMELADLYWKRGEYSQAGALYEEILVQYPQLAYDVTIRTRIERQPDGNYLLLTPEEVVRRTSEAEPLVIFGTSAFRSGRFEGYPATHKERYYTVTGQVTNRGEEVLLDAEVVVTIYGFGTLVYDTQTIRIGQLRPGEKRAFSAKFSNFDDIENVNRYECVGTYRRQG